MATDVENLQTRRTTIIEELARIASRPDVNIDGHSISWGAYRRSLLEELEMIDKLIASTEGPIELHTQGFSG